MAGMGSSSSDESEEEMVPERTEGDLVPRPVWTGLTVMPRIQGLAAAAIDTKRARLCTVTNLHTKDGRQAGGEIALWSLRTTEMILSHTLATSADGMVKNTLELFYSGYAKSFIGIAGSSLIWAADHITLVPCGSLQAHDRQCLAAVMHKARHELYCFFADGVIKVLKVSTSVVRDAAKMRNYSKTDFAIARSWSAKVWCDTADVDEQQDLLVASAGAGVEIQYEKSSENGLISLPTTPQRRASTAGMHSRGRCSPNSSTLTPAKSPPFTATPSAAASGGVRRGGYTATSRCGH